ncbi:hypothetical protein BZM26_25955 [Paraburkholderia strydomiana]|nr:hypothetical protein BZM26_25955 [Paraburkholderia strydomiana]
MATANNSASVNNLLWQGESARPECIATGGMSQSTRRSPVVLSIPVLQSYNIAVARSLLADVLTISQPQRISYALSCAALAHIVI